MIPDRLTIQVDTREQRPLLFPKTINIERQGAVKRLILDTERVALDAGDYRLKEDPDACIVERKGSARELVKNLFDPRDSARQARALTRLREACGYPILLVALSPADMLVETPGGPDPGIVLQRLAETCKHFGLSLVVAHDTTGAAARRILGTFVAHLLVGHGDIG